VSVCAFALVPFKNVATSPLIVAGPASPRAVGGVVDMSTNSTPYVAVVGLDGPSVTVSLERNCVERFAETLNVT
jgi:hypothetical protein